MMTATPSLPTFRCSKCKGVTFKLFSQDVEGSIYVECDNCRTTARVKPEARLTVEPPGAIQVA
ncbi:hypothetical protein [Burkholderia pseudomallei]|uniref:hypothetical protein n=1 Tax=Burkholderia pseudomallei TaxID=28450 RepID=UPI000A1A2FB2|nr:hypothetical protein [Burkholderia pseudomallei]ARL04367.1 hypothetical protein BOC44_21630 [Burkholderia pseudomallei]